MTNTEYQLAQLDRQIENAKAAAELGKALENLSLNADFQKLVLEGYLKNEAVRLVHAKADPKMASADSQAKINRDIDAVGSLADYLRIIKISGTQAVDMIAQAEQAREEILSEEVE